MKITIIAVGKLKEDYLRKASEYYSNQISKHCSFKIIEIPDEKISDSGSLSEKEIVKDKEGSGIMSKILNNQYVISLAIDGKPLNTIKLKKKIFDCSKNEKDDIIFVIGGSLGLSDNILKRSDFKISFSPMTFPHQLMRIMLMEQISICFNN